MSGREWATAAYEALSRGETIEVRPRGHSMSGRISDGDLVTLQPYQTGTVMPGDVVLVRIQGRRYAHLVLHQVLEREPGRLLIGNNLGGTDGWVPEQEVYGRVTHVDSSSGTGSAGLSGENPSGVEDASKDAPVVGAGLVPALLS